MSRVSEHKKSKVGRPSVDSEMIRSRVERNLLSALDAFAASGDEPIPRSEAIRRIMSDWLSTHGFLKRADHAEPAGPATDAVNKMDAAIGADRKKRPRK